MKRLFLTALCSLFILTLMAQQVRYVKTSAESTLWSNQPQSLVFSDLQAAINASSSGDQVWVAAGIYYPISGIDGNTGRFLSFLMKDGVSVYGGFAGTEVTLNQRTKASEAPWDYTNQTILSGNYNKNGDSTDNSYHVVWFGTTDFSDTTFLEGFTIQHGFADGAADFNQKGGGAFLTRKSVIENCVVRYNVALYGGGIFSRNNARIKGCLFQHNKTWRQNGFGGAISCNSSAQIIENSQFENNIAAKDGGAIYGGINAEVIQCYFANNEALQNGGAVWAMTGQKTTECTFFENKAINGGALYTNYNNNMVSSSIFLANEAENGGAIYLASGKVGHKVYNTLIAHNEAEVAGGLWSGSELLLVHSTIVKNKSFVAGGISGTSSDIIYNAIIWGNSAGSYPQIAGDANISYTAIEGLVNPQQNNISLPEQTNDSVYFLNPTIFIGKPLIAQEYANLAQANYEISGLSVCKDVGTSTIPNFQFPPYDLNGNDRINGIPDMGAYELPCNPTAYMTVLSHTPHYAQLEIYFQIEDFDNQFVYEIDFGDSTQPIIASSILSSYAYDSAGIYHVTLSAYDTFYLCTATYTLTIEVLPLETSIQTYKTTPFNVFPNPAHDEVRITSLFDTENYILTIYNSMGKVIKPSNEFHQEALVNIKDWSSGIYFISLKNKSNNHIFYLKMIKY